MFFLIFQFRLSHLLEQTILKIPVPSPKSSDILEIPDRHALVQPSLVFYGGGQRFRSHHHGIPGNYEFLGFRADQPLNKCP